MTGHVAVVGAGVRGTQVLLRLAHHWRRKPPAAPVIVHLIDSWPAGPGRTWRTDQSPLLLMNGPISGTTAYRDGEGPDLFTWARNVATGRYEVPAWVREEAGAATADTYASRPFYGHYLRWVLERAVASLPPSVRVATHRATVTRTSHDGDRTLLELDDGSTISSAAVVLCLGWLPATEEPPANDHPWIAPGHPAEQALTAAVPGRRVLVRGMGMGFFDVMALLTQGRGGRFVHDDGARPGRPGRLRYLPSGGEPHLLVGSRRGVPYRSKPPVGAPAQFGHPAVSELIGTRRHRRWDFAAEILPAIRRDAMLAHYAVLLEHRPEAIRSGGVLLKQVRVAPETDWPQIVAEAVLHEADRLDLVRLERPGEGLTFVDPAAAQDWVVADIEADLAQAYLAERSPVKAAMRSVGDARRVIAPLVAFSGVSGASLPAYRRFMTWGAMMSGGPPAVRNAQLLALHRAGVMTFTGPGLTVAADPHGYLGTSAATPGARHRAEVLLDAWMHSPTVTASADPLVRSLAAAGRVRAHRVDGVASGALEVEPEASRVVAADGSVAPALFSLGIPSEGQRVFTILSPRPGTDSEIIAECRATAGAVAELVG